MNDDVNPSRPPTPERLGGSRSERHEDDRLRAALGAVASRHEPRPDADWSDVLTRAEAIATPSAGGRLERGVRSTRTWLAGAAVIALVTGIAVVAVIRPDRGDRDAVRTIDTAPSEPTGWYVPRGLPEGWTVTGGSIEGFPPEDFAGPCPCTAAVWTGPTAVVTHRTSAMPVDKIVDVAVTDDVRPVDLGGGRTGTIAHVTFVGAGSSPVRDAALVQPAAVSRVASTLRWIDDRGPHELTVMVRPGHEWNDDQVAQLGREILAGDETPASLDGYEALGTRRLPDPTADPASILAIVVELRAPSGSRLSFTLAKPGYDLDFFEGGVPTRVAGDDLPAPTFRIDGDPATFDRRFGTRFHGRWPGADVFVGDRGLQDGDHPSDAELMTLLRSLRPATVEEWTDFVHVRPPNSTRWGTLADLGELPSSGPTSSSPTTATSSPCAAGDGSCTTTTTTRSWEVSPASRTITLPPDHPDWDSGRYDRLADLDLGLAVDSESVVSGRSVHVNLLLHNPTDRTVVVRSCAIHRLRVGFVPAADPGTALPPGDSDCITTDPRFTLEPGGTALLWAASGEEVFARRRDPALGITTGTLDPGAYLVAVDLPTPDGLMRVTVPVEVTPHPCGGFDDALAQRYELIPLDEAQKRASADGRPLRVVSIDGVGQPVTDDLRCDRIDAVVATGSDGPFVQSIDIY